MGTWAVQRDKIPGLIEELDAFLKKAYGIAGDDQFFDDIGSAQERLKEMASHEWRECSGGLINLFPIEEDRSMNEGPESVSELKINKRAENKLIKKFKRRVKKAKLKIKILNFVNKVLDTIIK
jgi:hypothetical protein